MDVTAQDSVVVNIQNQQDVDNLPEEIKQQFKRDVSSTPLTIPTGNQLPPVELPSYTNAQLEEYIENMRKSDEEMFLLFKEYERRWKNDGACEDTVRWILELKAKMLQLREVVLLRCLASYEEMGDELSEFESHFEGLSYINKIIYFVAREHNKKEDEEAKKYKESLEKEVEERKKREQSASTVKEADNINFE